MAQHKLRVDNAGLIKMHWTIAGSFPMNNILGCMGTAATPVDQSMANALDTAIKSALTSTGLAMRLYQGVVYQQTSIKSIHQEDLPEFLSPSTSPVTGTGPNDGLPRNVALVATLKTAMSGKQNRGRFYLSGFDEGENDVNGNASASAQTELVNFLTAVQSAIGARGLQMAVVSRPVWQINEPPLSDTQIRAGHATAVTSISVRSGVWGSQRGRAHRA